MKGTRRSTGCQGEPARAERERESDARRRLGAKKAAFSLEDSSSGLVLSRLRERERETERQTERNEEKREALLKGTDGASRGSVPETPAPVPAPRASSGGGGAAASGGGAAFGVLRRIRSKESALRVRVVVVVVTRPDGGRRRKTPSRPVAHHLTRSPKTRAWEHTSPKRETCPITQDSGVRTRGRAGRRGGTYKAQVSLFPQLSGNRSC